MINRDEAVFRLYRRNVRASVDLTLFRVYVRVMVFIRTIRMEIL